MIKFQLYILLVLIYVLSTTYNLFAQMQNETKIIGTAQLVLSNKMSIHSQHNQKAKINLYRQAMFNGFLKAGFNEVNIEILGILEEDNANPNIEPQDYFNSKFITRTKLRWKEDTVVYHQNGRHVECIVQGWIFDSKIPIVLDQNSMAKNIQYHSEEAIHADLDLDIKIIYVKPVKVHDVSNDFKYFFREACSFYRGEK